METLGVWLVLQKEKRHFYKRGSSLSTLQNCFLSCLMSQFKTNIVISTQAGYILLFWWISLINFKLSDFHSTIIDSMKLFFKWSTEQVLQVTNDNLVNLSFVKKHLTWFFLWYCQVFHMQILPMNKIFAKCAN